MTIHPIIDLLKRIVVALPDYAGGGGGSLPGGISAIATGTFILADDVVSYTITHNLGVKPRVLIAWCGQYITVNNIRDYTVLKTLEVVLSKLGTTGSSQNNNVGVIATTSSGGNIGRSAYLPDETDITSSTAVIKGTSTYPLTSTISTSSETTVATWYWIAVAE